MDFTLFVLKNIKRSRGNMGEKGKMEERGIDPLTSRMLSERSTI